ncbi:pseudouridine synthase [Mesorhizobium sp. BAC0120]|uniref:pseudouridine synthase n=1 Tax=Mesorhizobium sp. BAC0120 TaxID=3090670 RepID=UPI00298C123F|nr:pseudouridine synthase [Mesorhizobium sp. BAC0120]MDW6024094.1 pseudouridine synthase [Mesorhizobium sp. BAC0120]
MADKDNDKRNERRGPKRAGEKPFAKRGDRPGFAGKPSGGKSFAERRSEAGGERPARRFGKGSSEGRKSFKPFTERRDEAGGERPARTYGKGSSEGRKSFRPFAERRDEAGGGERPARAFGRGSGEGRKSFRPFAERGDEGGERPARAFGRGSGEGRKSFRPFAERGDEGGERPARPFGKGSSEGRKSFKKPGQPRSGSSRHERTDGDKPFGRSAQRGPRPAASFGGNRPSNETGEVAVQSTERIAKRLARAGIASRRDAEALIVDGRVKVNGVVLTSPAVNVTASDRIELDGTEIPPVERTRLFLFHKPAGVVTTNRDPEGRRTVFDVLPEDLPRLITVGRLDINTEGLLLLTNDGGLARVLELPSTGWLRRYRVRVHGKVNAEALAGLKQGIAVDGVFYGSVEASLDREQGSNAWLTIGLREGKNREVKNILGALGLEVTRLIRISYGPFQLGDLAEGALQELKGRTLRDQLGERLIEEAGANFDAPVVTPFSNKPVRVGEEPNPDRPARPRIVRDGIQGKIGEGGLIKQRRRDRGDERASLLSRLTTKPDSRGSKGGKDKPFGGPGTEKAGQRQEPPRARTSNVWMAPGARPQGKKTPDTSAPPAPRLSPSKARGEDKGEGQRPRFKKRTEAQGEQGASSIRDGRSPRGRTEGQGKGKGRGGADRRR